MLPAQLLSDRHLLTWMLQFFACTGQDHTCMLKHVSCICIVKSRTHTVVVGKISGWSCLEHNHALTIPEQPVSDPGQCSLLLKHLHEDARQGSAMYCTHSMQVESVQVCANLGWQPGCELLGRWNRAHQSAQCGLHDGPEPWSEPRQPLQRLWCLGTCQTAPRDSPEQLKVASHRGGNLGRDICQV